MHELSVSVWTYWEHRTISFAMGEKGGITPTNILSNFFLSIPLLLISQKLQCSSFNLNVERGSCLIIHFSLSRPMGDALRFDPWPDWSTNEHKVKCEHFETAVWFCCCTYAFVCVFCSDFSLWGDTYWISPFILTKLQSSGKLELIILLGSRKPA